MSGGSGFQLTVNGTELVTGSVVKWNGSPRTTTFVSNSQLIANIQSSDIATDNTATITAVNPGPGGGTSNSVFFPVSSDAPFSPTYIFNRADFPAANACDLFGAESQGTVVFHFDGDGINDVAVLDCNGDRVVILQGKSDGTFQPPVGLFHG